MRLQMTIHQQLDHLRDLRESQRRWAIIFIYNRASNKQPLKHANISNLNKFCKSIKPDHWF